MKFQGPLLIAATHPTQFLGPWAQHLHRRFRDGSSSSEPAGVMVWYVTLPDERLQGSGFGQSFSWDIDVLGGYPWQQLGNRSTSPSLDRFHGTQTGGVIARLRGLAPSAVLITGWHQVSLLQIAVACRWLGIPVLIRAEASSLKPRSALKRGLHRLLMKLFDGYLYIGAANRQYYRDGNAPASHLFFSPYFVDNERLRLTDAKMEALRKKWRARHHLTPAHRVILFVGKLQSKKHPEHVLEALTLLTKRNGERWLVVFAGEGACRDELERLASAADLPVMFCGFVNQSGLPEVYAGADCLVLPSAFEETWGLVVNEAMNFGLPVVVSDQVGSGEDLVVDNETGYVFPFGQTDQLAAALSRVFVNDEQRARLGRNARQRVASYSIEAASDGLVAGWQAVVEEEEVGCR